MHSLACSWGALLLAVALPACSGAPPAPGTCRFTPVVLQPEAPRRFAGQAAGVELRLTSERDGAEVESFPDSPLHIRSAVRSCETEGGVWQRRGFFVAADGRTLAALESSGSNDTLVFIDTPSCRRVGRIDVSGSHWRFVDGAVLAARPHRLDAACRPVITP